MGWINIQLEEEDHRQLKIRAAEEGREIKKVAVDAIRMYLATPIDKKKGDE